MVNDFFFVNCMFLFLGIVKQDENIYEVFILLILIIFVLVDLFYVQRFFDV